MSFTFGPGIAALFMIVFARVGVLVMLMPALGERMAPARVRLALAIFLSLAMMPTVRAALPPQATQGNAVFTTLFLELAIGLMIGLCARIVVASLQTAGNFVSQALGLGFAETVDPSQGGQAAALGNLLTMLGVTLLFATDGHHVVIAAIGGSYAALPPGAPPPPGDAAMLALSTMGKGFAIAVQVAAPFIVFGVIINLGLGVLSRLMPALQVFFLGMPATILIGFVILLASIGLMMGIFLREVSDFLVPFATPR